MEKYALDRKLNEIPMGEYRNAVNLLLKEIGCSRNSLKAWRKLQIGMTGDIPSESLAIIAAFFGCKEEDLRNYPVKTKAYDMKVMEGKSFLKNQRLVA